MARLYAMWFSYLLPTSLKSCVTVKSPFATLSSTIQNTLLYVFMLVFTPFHGTLSQQTRRQSQGQGAMLPGWNYALWFVVVRYSSRLNYFSTACVIRSVEVRHARGQQSTASVIGPANYPDYGRSSLPGAQLASGLRAVGHFAGLLAADSRLRRAGNDLRQFSEKPQPHRV